MFLIRTRVGPSRIHGNGVFACESVSRGTEIWRFDPLFDRIILDEELPTLPPAFREFIEMYAYRSSDLDGRLVLSCDHAKFLNHSADPNTREVHFSSLASRQIESGDEITCNYGDFCVDWRGLVTDVKATSSQNPPHHNLYTRIKVSANGVGVFAIRDIPKGTPLFSGDVGETVAVPESEVEAIADEEVRRMYTDFCPLVDGCFVAPRDFNQITMGWYLNHSAEPNVAASEDLRFIASRFLPKGEELLTDYTTYSAHAPNFVGRWKVPGAQT